MVGVSLPSRSQSPDPLRFCRQVREAFLGAVRSVGGAVERDLGIAGHTLRLRFAGSGLLPMVTPALEHLTAPPAASGPDLTVCLWDSASTAVLPPEAPWTRDQFGLRGEVRGFGAGRVLAAVQPDAEALSLLDRERRLGFYWVRDGGTLPAYERAAPLKVLLHWWLREYGLPMIHAAAVGTSAGCALLVGHTGAGKSTASLACLSNGLHYISDDRCVLGLEPEPRAFCIYNTAKLHAEQMQRFPHLLPLVSNVHELPREKALVFIGQCAPDRLAQCLPIRAILLAKVAPRPETRLTPASPMQVLRELAISSLIHQPGAAQDELGAMAELVRRVPCYEIGLGSELAQIPAVVAGVIE